MELAFRLFRGDLAIATDGLKRGLDGVKTSALRVQQGGSFGITFSDAGHQNLSGDVGIAEFASELLRSSQRVERIAVELGLAMFEPVACG